MNARISKKNAAILLCFWLLSCVFSPVRSQISIEADSFDVEKLTTEVVLINKSNKNLHLDQIELSYRFSSCKMFAESWPPPLILKPSASFVFELDDDCCSCGQQINVKPKFFLPKNEKVKFQIQLKIPHEKSLQFLTKAEELDFSIKLHIQDTSIHLKSNWVPSEQLIQYFVESNDISKKILKAEGLKANEIWGAQKVLEWMILYPNDSLKFDFFSSLLQKTIPGNPAYEKRELELDADIAFNCLKSSTSWVREFGIYILNRYAPDIKTENQILKNLETIPLVPNPEDYSDNPISFYELKSYFKFLGKIQGNIHSPIQKILNDTIIWARELAIKAANKYSIKDLDNEAEKNLSDANASIQEKIEYLNYLFMGGKPQPCLEKIFHSPLEAHEARNCFCLIIQFFNQLEIEKFEEYITNNNSTEELHWDRRFSDAMRYLIYIRVDSITKANSVLMNNKFIINAFDDCLGDTPDNLELQKIKIKACETIIEFASTDSIATKPDFDLASYYEDITWHYLLAKEFEKAELVAAKGLELDFDGGVLFPDQMGIVKNYAHALLFQGKYEEAKAKYSKYKDNFLWNFSFLQDFDDLEKQGITHPDVEKIRTLLNE